MQRILLLEDNESFGYILSEYLRLQDYEIAWVKSGSEALELIAHQRFDLAILDIMLPDTSGFELAEQIKLLHSELPFIFLSAKSLKVDKLKGYKAGAIDYITKPVDEELLVAKIKVLIGNRRPQPAQTTVFQIGAYSFDAPLQQLTFQGNLTKLTSREAALLEMLCLHQNKLLPRKKALQQIWGNVDEFSRKSMDVFISHLRKYLAEDDAVSIENVHGNGFVLRTPG